LTPSVKIEESKYSEDDSSEELKSSISEKIFQKRNELQIKLNEDTNILNLSEILPASTILLDRPETFYLNGVTPLRSNQYFKGAQDSLTKEIYVAKAGGFGVFKITAEGIIETDSIP
jgi:hypothetical protein